MSVSRFRTFIATPAFKFIVGWAIVMLSLTFAIGKPWETFIHMWRVEFVASIFLAVVLLVLLVRGKEYLRPKLHESEFTFVVLPMLALIAWSSLSAIWASSWRSAIHHGLVWSEYLVFFILIRQILRYRGAMSASLWMLVACLAFAAIPAISGYISYQIFGGTLSTGILFQKSGEQVVCLLPLTLLAILRLRGRGFVLGVIAVAALWLLVLAGLGRINLALFVGGFTVTAVLAALFRTNWKVRRRLLAIAAMIVLVPTALFFSARLSSEETITVADRVVGTEGTQASNNFRKLMLTISTEMFKSNPIFGIGADNFGFQFNRFREAYGSRNPDDVNLAFAESEIAERAHNEFAQILAELGIIGGLIICWLLAGVAMMVYRAFRLRLYSPYRLAALFGVLIFLASSLVSSYSFRLIQNGFVFFFLLAVASQYFLKDRRSDAATSRLPAPRVFAIAGLAACLLLLAYSSLRVGSMIVTRSADETASIDEAAGEYTTAIAIDPENPQPNAHLGARLLFEKRFAEAAPLIGSSLAIGRATSTDFSYLATAYTLSGDDLAAADALGQASRMYPRSVFVLVRYAVLLERLGRADEAGAALDRARSVDPRAAATWHELITNGPLRASEAAFRDPSGRVAVMDLRPNESIYAVLDELEFKAPGSAPRVHR
jgi:O-antigen ligase